MKKLRVFITAIIMMAMTVTKRLTVVLDFPDDIDGFIVYARAIHQSMSSHPMFAASSAKLSGLLTNVNNLSNKQTGVKATLPTATVAERDVELLNTQNSLRSLKLDVQGLVDANPNDGETIVTAANMKLKQFGSINKQDFVVGRGPLSGSAKLTAKGLQVRHAHEWEKSLDGTNWVHMNATLQASTIAGDLTIASILDFRHRYVLKDGPTDWIYFNDFVVT